MKISLTLLSAVFMVSLFADSWAGERLQAEFFPQRHHSLRGKWKTKRITRNKSIGHGQIVAKLNHAEIRLQIPATYTASPQAVNIYMVLPTQIPGMRGAAGFEVSWKTRKTFQAGTARPGDRVLLYQGVVNSDVLSDFVSFQFTIDAAEMLGVVSFEPSYEIERR